MAPCLVAASTLIAAQGCAAAPRARTLAVDVEAAAAEAPGFRVCCLFSDDLPLGAEALGMGGFLEPRALRGHVYGGALAEDSGLVYTRRGGFLDLGHVRDYADWTVHLFGQLRAARATGAPIELPDHGGRAVLRLTRPDLDDEALLEVAQRAAYQFSVWHELATWHGWRTFPLYCERASAFSPEDLYSNLLGVHVGAEAVRAAAAPGADLDRALAEALAARLGHLGVLSAAASRAMLWKVEGPSGWWRDGVSGVLAVTRRYLEAGDLLVPWLVGPGEPMALTVPGRDLEGSYSLEIVPDPQATPGLPPQAVGSVGPANFPRLLEEARRQLRCVLGPLADRPVVVRTVAVAGGYLLVYRGDDGAWHTRAVTVDGGRDRTYHAAATHDPAVLVERLRALGVDEQRREAIVLASGES